MKSFDVTSLLGVPGMGSCLKQVEQKLDDATTTDNLALLEPVSRLIHAPGKRLRSMLVIAVAASQGRRIDQAVIAGCAAIELVHIGSLVHDDIIDDAATRWNIPTVNSQEGTDQAILVGDYLFAKAGVVASGLSAEAAALISSTIAALVDGESREVADLHNMDRSMESLLTSIRGKTASLISAACQMGGLCANLDSSQTKALARYGESFGMAFQLIDDTLDFLSSPELMGKPVGNDIKEGVYTMPVLLALDGPRRKEVEQLLSSANASPTLTQLLIEDKAIEKTILTAKEYNRSAKKALRDFDGASGLVSLPSAYMEWALANLTA